MDTTDFELLTIDTVSEHVFDIVVNRAPAPESDLGFYSRTDGEIIVQIKVPNSENIGNSRPGVKEKKKRSRRKGHNGSSTSLPLQLTTSTLEVSVVQNMSLLNSRTETSTTGAMLWRVSVVFVEWFYQQLYASYGNRRLLGDRFDVVELGCGAAALLPIALGTSCPLIREYIATDQPHIARLARQNVARHFRENGKMGADIKTLDHVHIVEYDWELAEEYLPNISELLRAEEPSDNDEYNVNGSEDDVGLLVIACDTIYNEYLIPHFLDALARVCGLSRTGTAHVFIAQQIRDPVVLEAFLTQLVEHPQFKVWSIPESVLSDDFKQGFALHYCQTHRDNDTDGR